MTSFLVVDTQLYKRLCLSVGPSVHWSVHPSVRKHESKSGKTRISAPAHQSATDGRESGLVIRCVLASLKVGLSVRPSVSLSIRPYVGPLRLLKKNYSNLLISKQGQVGQLVRRVDRRTNALQTDRPTDRPTDQPTDTASYRGALSKKERTNVRTKSWVQMKEERK